MDLYEEIGKNHQIEKAVMPRLHAGFQSGAKNALTGGGKQRGGSFGMGQRAGSLAAKGTVQGITMGRGALTKVQGLSTGKKVGLGAGIAGGGGYLMGRKKS